MFFIAMYVCQLIGKGISSIGAASDNRASKNRAMKRREEGNNPFNIYVDRLGATRDIDTDEIKNIWRVNGEQIICDKYGNTICNLSLEQSQTEFNKARDERPTFVTVVKWGKDRHIHEEDKCIGERYKDLKTGDLYVARELTCINEHGSRIKMSFFMNADTGEYVRPTDYEIQRWTNYGKLDIGLQMAREGLKNHYEFKQSSRIGRLDKYDNSKWYSGQVEAEKEMLAPNQYTINF